MEFMMKGDNAVIEQLNIIVKKYLTLIMIIITIIVLQIKRTYYANKP